jgi:hypothetical protein
VSIGKKSDLVVALKGGLGNQLFQWSFGEALLAAGAQVRYDVGLFADGVGLELGPLVDESRLLTLPTKVRRARRRLHLPAVASPWREVAEPRFAYTDPAELNLNGRRLLEGYWQSPRYFASIEPMVRATLEAWATRSLTDEGRALLAEIQATAGACSVHVRRGDYLAADVHAVHGLLDADYYRRAIARARADGASRFYVFTNDHAWVDSELAADDVVAVPWSVADHPIGEVGLMAECSHHVVANSSFSWWGAWLGDDGPRTYAPEQWFAAGHLDTSDLVPTSWRRVPNTQEMVG